MFCDVKECLKYHVLIVIKFGIVDLRLFLFLFVQASTKQLIVIKWKLHQDNCSLFLYLYTVEVEICVNIILKLEAIRERRPPWPRQIITLILPTVKMLSLGCERLPTPLTKKNKKKRFWIITCTVIWICYHYYGVFLLIYSSYNTQITTKI